MKTAILSLLCLLAVVASASAECAWVMWFFTPGETSEWLPVGGWKGPDQCEQERLRRQSTANPPRGSYWVCFPDTVDPRGPKGK